MLDVAVVAAPAHDRVRLRWWARPLAVWAAWRLFSFCAFVATGGKPIVGAARWDDGYYLTILRQGYRPNPDYGVYQQTEFFPLLPWTTRVVQAVVRSETVAVHLVVTAASLASVLLVYVIARRLRDEKVALLAVAILVASPGSIFLWNFFSEGLFVALSAGALLAALTRRPLLAAALGAGVAMTRPHGALIVIPLLVAQLEQRPPSTRWRLDRKMLSAFVPIAGLLVVMAAQWWQAGDPFAYPKVSAKWGRHNTLPITPLIGRLQEMLVLDLFNAVTLSDWLCILVALWMCAYSLKTPFPLVLRSWMIVMTLTPLFSGLAHCWSRFVLTAWPAAILVAEKVRLRPRITVATIFLALAFLEVQIVSAWHGGFFVG